MLENPYLPSPARASAWAEGFTKGYAGSGTPEAGPTIDADGMDAFNEGVLTGEESAANGLESDVACLVAPEDPGPAEDVLHAWDGIEVAHGLWEMRHLRTLAAGIAGIAVVLVELAITLPAHTLPPEQVLPSLGQPMVDALAAYGLDSIEVFCGAGLDPSATDCEILISPLFKSQDTARQAAEAMGRSLWVVASWRTDQSGSFRLVDAN
ncbi:hypothetical protein [Solirubrobacter soli]|uniref:hypothetical protein n=1 Tax=Solirubrobacter soli TaxID=363832 RepID=UPI00042A55F3|nr:hypothetical protein [Solirubrobacter soli]